MNGQPTHLPVICSILNIPMETIIKKLPQEEHFLVKWNMMM